MMNDCNSLGSDEYLIELLSQVNSNREVGDIDDKEYYPNHKNRTKNHKIRSNMV